MVMSRFTKMSCNLLAAIRLKLSEFEERGECMFRNSFGAALALGLLFGISLAHAQAPDIGQPAPQFSLSTPDGKHLSLSEFTGKGPVVLVVLRGYPGYQCPYCVRQVHDFVENAGKFADDGARVLLVYPGPPAALDQHAKEFLTKQNPLPQNVHLLIDPDYKFTNQYGLRWDAPHETAYPSTFLIDRHGIVFFRKISTGHGDRTTAADTLAELQRAGTGH
jgi:peroxiredoxin